MLAIHAIFNTTRVFYEGLKNFGILILFACVNMISTLRAENWDTEADKQITAIVNSSVYTNQEILYSYAGQKWNLRLIHAPSNEVLECRSSLITFCPFYLLTKESVPEELFSHLQELGEKFLESEPGNEYRNSGYFYSYNSFFRSLSVFDNSGSFNFTKAFVETGRFFSNGGSINDSTSFEYFANPQIGLSSLQIPPLNSLSCPIATALKIDDPSVDSKIQEIWASKAYTDRVFCYQLDGSRYNVRIIHNPDYLRLQAKQEFKVDEKAQTFTAYWDSKYGILIDKKAPQQLIDHLSRLANISWYDWFYNQLKIYNGTKVKVSVDGFLHRSIPWFNFMEGLQYGEKLH